MSDASPVYTAIFNPATTPDVFQELLEQDIVYWLEDEVEREHYTAVIVGLEEANRPDLLVTFVKLLQDTNPAEDEYPIATLLLSLDLSPSTITFLSDNVVIDYFETVCGLFTVEDDLQITRALGACDRIFPDIPPATYVVAFEKFLEQPYHNHLIQKYLGLKISETSEDIAPIPSWVIPGSEVPGEEVIASRIPAPSKYRSQGTTADVEYLIENNYVSPEATLQDPEQVRQVLRGRLTRMTARERSLTIQELINNTNEMLLALDPVLFGVFGPCHRMPAAIRLSSTDKDPCRRWGGCRMLTCYENENMDDLTDEPRFKDERAYAIEWFTGRCGRRECPNRILAKHYAVRMPLAIGGWEGCYCSFECMSLVTPSTDEVQLTLIEEYRSLVKKVGIYDRSV